VPKADAAARLCSTLTTEPTDTPPSPGSSQARG
jgi:hypothetical protein